MIKSGGTHANTQTGFLIFEETGLCFCFGRLTCKLPASIDERTSIGFVSIFYQYSDKRFIAV